MKTYSLVPYRYCDCGTVSGRGLDSLQAHFIWSMYQSVPSREVFTTRTSVRQPSISCAYQSGKVSLSPWVTSMPFGPTEFR